jgi:hypothetical protein
MATTSKVKIQIGDEVIELTGAELEAFLADRAAMQAEQEAFEAEQVAKAEQKQAILERLGLTEDELKVVLNG